MNHWLASKGPFYDAVFLAPERRSDAFLIANEARSASAVTADWDKVTSWMSPKALLHPPPSGLPIAVKRLEKMKLLDRLLDWYIG